jgi:glucokinase
VILAGDIGATKILLEVGELRSDGWAAAQARRYSTTDADDFPAVLTAFLGEWNRHRARDQRITAATFGAAGLLEGNRIKMTRRAWVIDGDKIASRFLIAKVRVVNDLAAIAHGIAWLGSRDIVTLQAGKMVPGDPRVVIGVGTGLGVAYLVSAGKGAYREVASEGGHMGFAPASAPQAELWSSIFAAHGRVSAEDVVSGEGLEKVKAHVGTEEGALELFFECLGNVAGDHALTMLARGGVYLAGGVVARNIGRLPDSRFLEFFAAKSPHNALMMKIPVFAIGTERAGVLGAAKLATEL